VGTVIEVTGSGPKGKTRDEGPPETAAQGPPETAAQGPTGKPAAPGGGRRHGDERGRASAGQAAWEYLADLMFSDTVHEHMHESCEQFGLSPGHAKALLFFEPGPPVPMKILATNWRCDASYVTALVDALEERGLVTRRSHPADRRAKLVELTPLGEQTRRAFRDRLSVPPPSFGVLTPAEQRTLRDLLAKVLDAGSSKGRSSSRDVVAAPTHRT
jgi:DNA-binding MarR family transcriptional regulator